MAENVRAGKSAPKRAWGGFTPGKPQAGKKYSGVITYIDEVRQTFITQYEYESGRLGYPVEHSLDKANFPYLSANDRWRLLKVGDVVEVGYPRGKNRCDVNVKDTAENKDLVRLWCKEDEELEAARSKRDKETIKEYAHPKNEDEAEAKNMAVLRESSRNKRFENVKVIAKDDEKHTVTTSNGKGDDFVHEAEEWGSFETIRVGDTLSIDYLKQRFPYVNLSTPQVINYGERERIIAAGFGDPDFAKGGEFDHVTITAIDRDKNTITTQDAQGKTVVHDARRWGGICGERGVFRTKDTALYQAGDVVSIRIPKTFLDEPYSVLNYTYFKRIIDKYKLLEKQPGLLDFLSCYPANPPGTDWRNVKSVERTIERIGRFFDYNAADELNPYKGLTLTKIDRDKNTITAVNAKGETSVHSAADYRYISSLRVGDTLDVRYNDLGHPEKGLKIFDRSAYERQKVKDRFKEVRIIAIDREKDIFTTEDSKGGKFDHSMRDYKWKNRLQVGHLVTIQYKDNDVTKAQDVFDHTTCQESLINSLRKRTMQEGLARLGEKTLTARINAMGKNYVFLENMKGSKRPFFVLMDELTKALDCKSCDLKLDDEIQLKMKGLPRTDGSHEVLSAQSMDIEERIRRQDYGLER